MEQRQDSPGTTSIRWGYRQGRCPFTHVLELDRWTVHREGQLVGKVRRVSHGSARFWVTVFLIPEQFHRSDSMAEALELVRQLVGSNPVDPNAR